MEEEKTNGWDCPLCTFKNKANAKKCEECDSLAPHLESSKGKWVCPNCTLENSGLMPVCEVCETPRPSNDSKGKGQKEPQKQSTKLALTPQNTMKETKSKPVEAPKDEKKGEPAKKSYKELAAQYKSEVANKKTADDDGKKGSKKGGKSVDKDEGGKKKVASKPKGKKGDEDNDLVVEGSYRLFSSVIDKNAD